MNTAAYLIVTVLIASASYFGIKWLVGAYSRYRGTKIVTCPETVRPAIVEVDALHASFTSTVGPPDIRLENCWRWPLKEQWGQECLADLDVAPGKCLVSGVLMRWYRGKTYIAQSFRGDHPDMVGYRPWRNDIVGGADGLSASRHSKSASVPG